MAQKFSVTAKKGTETIVEVHGIIPVEDEYFSRADLNKVIETERFLEKITGLRWHINPREVD